MSERPCVPTEASRALHARLDDSFATHDTEAAIAAVADAVEAGALGVDELYCDVLVPLLTAIGTRWFAGDTRVWEEHLVSAAVRAIIESVRPLVRAGYVSVAAEHAGVEPKAALFACPPEEWHELSLRMLADRFAMDGWRTYYLGADVPIEEIVDAARTLGAALVVLTAATHYERVQLRDLVDGVRRRLAPIRLLVGGPAFSAEHDDWSADELVDPESIPDAYA